MTSPRAYFPVTPITRAVEWALIQEFGINLLFSTVTIAHRFK